MASWFALIVLTIFIMFIGWVGNLIVDKSSDAVRNSNIRRQLKSNPPKQELLSDRFK